MCMETVSMADLIDRFWRSVIEKYQWKLSNKTIKKYKEVYLMFTDMTIMNDSDIKLLNEQVSKALEQAYLIETNTIDCEKNYLFDFMKEKNNGTTGAIGENQA